MHNLYLCAPKTLVMTLQEKLEIAVKEAVKSSYDVALERVEISLTRKDQTGDLTVLVFPMLRQIKGNPAAIAEQIGKELQENTDLVESYEVIKGFLNLNISTKALVEDFQRMATTENYGTKPVAKNQPAVVVEYSSPNTNKPLHLGHIRNNLLGYSVSEIIKATGQPVIRTQIINDRGIHICKSMLAWQQFGNGETPESSGMKGDHLVGKYYVVFEQKFQEEYQNWIQVDEGKETLQAFLRSDKAKAVTEGKEMTLESVMDDEGLLKTLKSVYKDTYFNQHSDLGKSAKEMLRNWEKGDLEVTSLWQKMNGWVYAGFDKTYDRLGVAFDHLYYESDTYLLGKRLIDEGLKKNVFFKKDDGSVWCDLTDEGLDEKLVLRSDGTAVYMTQDLGTATQRAEDHDVKGMVYTVGNEQDYHFKVLFLVLKKLGYDWADHLFHLSYGMVDLPEGKMKSREGNVVDADDLLQQMHDTAKNIAAEQGKLEGLNEEEKNELYEMIGLGALKYFILKVDPKKRILFDPKESVDFQGNTGPFIQYTHARIKSILDKAGYSKDQMDLGKVSLSEYDKSLILNLQEFPAVVERAAAEYSPALIANYIYDLVKLFNSFYQNSPKILEEQDEAVKQMRLTLCATVGGVIASGFGLLGIMVPEQM